ncbi:hypothetical protein I6N90_14990 [Paenibacillus sp. GSMTC-2017]|uniref:hypothetical protein n=1 Tax=Paenibacillus sp. GSMTC-2017 TaxID=2794350 RepID=UPI0018D825E2|nr:hypothetical protein [Paenibacillus sp. GSMTC-2017]MBH5319111.1 hypothetical protein [Paenibacillus sp. GSMTC-2017]
MLIRVAILLTLCSMLLISCSVSTNTNENQSLQYPTIVYIYIYRSDSIKPQPELISVISEAKLLETVTKEIQNADPHATIPTAEKIDSIFYFQFSYETKGITTRTEDYIYVSDMNGNYFIKSFKMMPQYDFDNYNTSEKELLLRNIGFNDWKSLSSPLLKITSPTQ